MFLPLPFVRGDCARDLCAFSDDQAQEPLSCHGEERLPSAEQVTESEEAGELQSVLAESPVANLPMVPLTLDHLEGMLHERPDS